MNTVTLNEAKQKMAFLIEQVNANVEPIVICSDEGNKAVLLSLDEFNAWEETIYLLSNPVNAEHLRKSILEHKTGKTIEKELIES